ncbi:ty3-gypsy retrotransposon protein [Tanacetum coccineum]
MAQIRIERRGVVPLDDEEQPHHRLAGSQTGLWKVVIVCSFWTASEEYEDPTGLKPNLQRELLVAKPATLGEVFALARVTEARLMDQQSGTGVATEERQERLNKEALFYMCPASGRVVHKSRSRGKVFIGMIQWLQKLGKVTHDYAKQTMEFTLVNTKYSLQGDESLRMKKISLHHMQALLETEDVYATTPEVADPVHPELEQLLTRFDSLFQVPTSLPPHRLIDHRIHLLPNTKPVNVRPAEDLWMLPGHIISRHGVEMDPKKVSAVREWPIPQSQRHVRGFLGLAGYYRRFIKGYATLAAPLTDLLRKDGFKWGDRESEAFKALKQQLSTTPVLGLPDFEKTFTVETDASGDGIGAVLLQNNKPICYFSRKLGPRMRLAATYQKELFAIVEAVFKWRQYLLGRRFIIRTDHKSIKELMQQVIQTPIQQKYVPLGFVYGRAKNKKNIKRGRTIGLWEELLRALIDKLDLGDAAAGFRQEGGLVIFQDRYFIETESKLKSLLLREFHNTPIAGHGGVKRMTQASGGYLYPFAYAAKLAVWDRCFNGLIPGDALSKGFVGLFVEAVVKHHGIPKTIVSDRDPIFVSKFWTQLFKLSGTQLNHSTAYHPQTDGQTEVVNRGLEQYLRAMHCMGRFRYPIHPIRLGSSKVGAAVEDLLVERDELLRRLRDNLLAAKNRMEEKANLKRREVEFNVGDKRIRKVAYRLALPVTSKIHPVFHVSILKPCLGSESEAVAEIPGESDEGFVVEQPLTICGSRFVSMGWSSLKTSVVAMGWEDRERTRRWEYLSDSEPLISAFVL